MTNQGHGSHWECLGNLDNMIAKILPKVLLEGDTIEKGVEWIDSLENKECDKHTAFSIAINAELTALAVCIASEKEETSTFASAYPFVQNDNFITLKITEIHEWDNLVESVIEGETEDGRMLSFFDTKYFKNKELYQVGKTYLFSIAALGYNLEILKEKTFSFEGQKAVDWLAKIGNKPDYDEQGNVKPVVFDLSNLVSFFPRTDYSDDAEFQSPINSIETVNAFDNEFYVINITVFRDPDVCIDLYAKTSFFNHKPNINEPLRGVIWLQGYLAENTAKQQSGLLNSDGEPIIN
jgi:hypothetical protein